MKDKHTINLILISSKWVIPSFGVCFWWINSSSKCFHLFFSGVQISSAISLVHPSKSSQGFNLIPFILQFYLVILLLPEFITVARHDLIHSSSVHQDSCRQSSSIFSSRVSKCNWFSVFFWSGVLHIFILLSYPIISICGRLSPYDLEMLSISP